MATKMITRSGTIRASHAVREDFSRCSSGNGIVNYYETKGAAVFSFASALREYGLCFDPADMICMLGDKGRVHIDVYVDISEGTKLVGSAMLMWYRMDQSGRWEFTGYLT